MQEANIFEEAGIRQPTCLAPLYYPIKPSPLPILYLYATAVQIWLIDNDLLEVPSSLASRFSESERLFLAKDSDHSSGPKKIVKLSVLHTFSNFDLIQAPLFPFAPFRRLRGMIPLVLSLISVDAILVGYGKGN